MKKMHFLSFVALLVLSLALFTACSNNDTPNSNATQNNNATAIPDNGNSITQTPRTVMPDGNTSAASSIYDKSRSEKIAKAITDNVKECKDAVVITVGNMAYIAVDIGADDTKTEAADIRNRIYDVVMEADTNISDVYISEDADMLTRMKGALEKLADGDMMQSLREFENMFTRIMPKQ